MRYLILIICLNLFTAGLSAKDFRKSSWGSNKEEIRLKAKGKLVKEADNFLIYKGKLGKYATFYTYIFKEDQLTNGWVNFRQIYKNKNKYFFLFNRLKKGLTKKFGKPVKDEAIWTDDSYKRKRGKWGTAVAYGHLKYEIQWKKGDSRIDLLLYSNNEKPRLDIRYTSIKLEKYFKEKAIEMANVNLDDEGVSGLEGDPLEEPLKMIFFNVKTIDDKFKNQSKLVENVLHSELYKYRDFDVLGRAELEKMDPGIGEQVAECSDNSCLLEVSAAFGADVILDTSLGKIKEKFLLSLNLMSVEDEKSLGRVSRPIVIDEKQLAIDVHKSMASLVDQYNKKFGKERGLIAKIKPEGEKKFWRLSNIIALSATAISGGVLAYGLMAPDKPAKKSDYQNEDQIRAYNAKADSYNSDMEDKSLFQTIGGVGLGVGLGTLFFLNF